MATLGWIGLGRRGAPMAERLIQAGHQLIAYDQVPELTIEGAVRASSPAEVAGACEAVFVCVTDTDAVESVANGMRRVDGAGKLVVDHSSIHPERTKTIATRLRDASGMGWVDAPVSGPVGSGAVFLGGNAAEVARVRPWIACYAGTATHMGPIGSGQIAKSCSQAVIMATIAAWRESLAAAKALGIDPSRLVEACDGAGSDSPVRRHFGAGLAAGHLPPDSARNFAKDLAIWRDLTRKPGPG